MISKDADLLAEAYLSAIQRSPNYPADPATASVARVNPEVTDIVNAERKPEASVVAVSGPVPVAQQGMTCGCDRSQEHEESEEHWMVRSNLFSLYSNAKKIHNILQSGIDPEPWAQQKIAVACQSVEDVMKYIAYEAAEKGIQA